MPLNIVFEPTIGQQLSFVSATLAASAAVGSVIGNLTSGFANPVASVLSGPVAVGAFTGGSAPVSLTSAGPASGSVTALIRVQDGPNGSYQNAFEVSLSVTVNASMGYTYTLSFSHS